MALTAPRASSAAACALVRAALADDIDAGVLIIAQHGGSVAGARGDVLRDFILALAGAAERAVLAANGGDVGQTMAMVDRWIEEYARQAGVLGG